MTLVERGLVQLDLAQKTRHKCMLQPQVDVRTVRVGFPLSALEPSRVCWEDLDEILPRIPLVEARAANVTEVRLENRQSDEARGEHSQCACSVCEGEIGETYFVSTLIWIDRSFG